MGDHVPVSGQLVAVDHSDSWWKVHRVCSCQMRGKSPNQQCFLIVIEMVLIVFRSCPNKYCLVRKTDQRSADVRMCAVVLMIHFSTVKMSGQVEINCLTELFRGGLHTLDQKLMFLC